jgi:glycine/D-amino acid oxidase-like deaminating enzyme
MARVGDPLSESTLETLRRTGVPHERLPRAALETRWPQIDFGPIAWGVFEPEAGVLLARRAVQAAARQAVAEGATYELAAVAAPTGAGRLSAVTLNGRRVAAGAFVFALGPWLGTAFPALLSDRIFPTRQEVFYFGTPAGDPRFQAPALPAWIDFGAEIYGIPDLESRGFKVAPDRHGPAFDPERGERVVTPATLAAARAYLEARFPALRGAPLVASEVCQYENSSNGDFLIDRHPELDDVWIAGGGSGHGFKHGPAVGEHVAGLIDGSGAPEPRFGLATKARVQKRTVH